MRLCLLTYLLMDMACLIKISISTTFNSVYSTYLTIHLSSCSILFIFFSVNKNILPIYVTSKVYKDRYVVIHRPSCSWHFWLVLYNYKKRSVPEALVNTVYNFVAPLVKKCQNRRFTPVQYALYTPKFIGLWKNT